MSDGIGDANPHHQQTIYRALSHHRRRLALEFIVESDHQVDDAELATGLLEESPSATDSLQRLLVDLRHVHLPLLDEAGLIAWEPADGSVAPTDHLQESTLLALLEAADALGDERLDIVTHPRRRQVLSAGRDRSSPVPVSELVDALLEDENEGESEDVTITPERRQKVRVSLSSTHLPRLEDADLLAFDPADDTVTFRGYNDDDTTRVRDEHSRMLLSAPSLT